MKKFRENINGNTFFVCSTHKDRFVHDTIKGWGRISPSGKTVLWEGWRRPPKQNNQKSNLGDFSKFCMPMIKQTWSELSLADILSVQPLNLPSDKK